jgi:NAD(P)-dependent dehydrogenase (short-subunit alcohol dehydrogenase family)
VSLFPGRFGDRTAIITGGASGLGRETARRLVAEGARVVLWDFDGDALADAARDVGAELAVQVDVADADAVAQAASRSEAALGCIDILVNSAGITGATVPVVEFPVESWRRTIDVDLNGVFYCCRAVVPTMLAKGYGRIVNVSSVAGKEGNPNASAYSAAKAALLGFTKSLGKELASRGVVVNALTPATFESPILEQVPQTHIDYMRSKIPMGRLGEVQENVAVVCFMASEECSFTTASTFDTSGGRTTY